MSLFHVTSHYLPGDKLAVFPRTSDFFPDSVVPEHVKTVTVDQNGLADVGDLTTGPYWLKAQDGPSIRIDVHAGNQDPAWLEVLQPPKAAKKTAAKK